MIYNKKLAAAIIATVIVLTGILVFLIFGAVGIYKGDDTDTTKSTELTERPSVSSKNQTTGTTGNIATTERTTITEKEVPITEVNAISKDGQYVIMDGEDVDVFLTGVAKATIDGKTELYYFDSGVFNPTYTGIALLANSTLGGKDQSYYVVNGVAQTSYTGTYTDAYTTYNIQNGIVQEHK